MCMTSKINNVGGCDLLLHLYIFSAECLRKLRFMCLLICIPANCS